MENKKIYMVQLDHSTADDEYVDTYLFAKYENAERKFYELQKMTLNTRWINNALDIEANPLNYDIDTNINDEKCVYYQCDLWYNFKLKNDYNYHFFLDLKQMEIE